MKKILEITVVSFIILFLELLLIRLIGTEIRIFAYYSNLLLLGIFVGSGAGMLIKKRLPIGISSVLLFFVITIVLFGWMANITDLLAPLSESFFWFQASGVSLNSVIFGLFLTFLLFFLNLGIFLPLGQYLGNLLESTNKLILFYSLNIAASLAGMWLFQAVSVFNISIYFGIFLIQFLFIILAENKFQKAVVIACLFLTAGVLVIHFSKPGNLTVWSPYQKLTLLPEPKTDLRDQGYLLQVNNVGYMGLLDLSDQYAQKIKKQLEAQTLPENFDLRFINQYNIPFLIKPQSFDVLIIGSGGGNDIAGALRANVNSIDAVEIDPRIINFGKKYHPEKPYGSGKVTVYNDDGRSFLKRTNKKYDIIILGLADSHTLTSSQTNVRLDHYLYTKESFEEIKQRLKPEGMVFLSFEVNREWIGERIQKGLSEVFGQTPLVFDMRGYNLFGWGGTMFVSSLKPGLVEKYLSQNSDLKNFIAKRQLQFFDNKNNLTDNWPYLYLDQPRLPRIHLWISAILLVLFLFLKGLVPSQGRFAWDFFFLGAGFLLFEFQNISKTALLFGNTWTTNLFTITFVLLFILLANLIQAKKPLPIKACYVGLIISLLAQFVVPLNLLNALPFFSKILISSMFLNLPFLFSGLIFIKKLQKTDRKASAFAANLLGSAVGGSLEMFAFLFGINSMLVFSLGLYLLSMANFTFFKNLSFFSRKTHF